VSDTSRDLSDTGRTFPLVSDEAKTYDEIAGESGEVASSLAAHLGQMDEGELLSLSDDLRDLLAHPGWMKLTELLAVQRNAIESGAARRLWAHFAAGHTLREQAAYIRLGGVMDGLQRPQRIVSAVLRTAEVVRRHIESNNGEAK
jgi:hypothetical protein